MSHRARILPHYTYDDYVQWEGRWEVIDGIPFAMSPSPHPKHQFLANEIGFYLKNQLDLKKCDCQVYQPIDLKIKDDVVLQPDLLIVCDKIEKPYLDFPPCLVVEILSPSTRLRDQNSKFHFYEDFEIQYYFMVDPENSTLDLYCLNESGRYAPHALDVDLSLEKDCTITLGDLSSVLFK